MSYQVGFSELVFRICKEYSESLGFNFPPCTSQALNAIAQYCEKNIKELKEKEVSLDAVALVDYFEGSDTVVVDLNESSDKIEIHLDEEIISKISRMLTAPVSNPTYNVLVGVNTRGAQFTTNLGGEKYFYTFVAKNSDCFGVFNLVGKNYTDPDGRNVFANLINDNGGRVYGAGGVVTMAGDYEVVNAQDTEAFLEGGDTIYLQGNDSYEAETVYLASKVPIFVI